MRSLMSRMILPPAILSVLGHAKRQVLAIWLISQLPSAFALPRYQGLNMGQFIIVATLTIGCLVTQCIANGENCIQFDPLNGSQDNTVYSSEFGRSP